VIKIIKGSIGVVLSVGRQGVGTVAPIHILNIVLGVYDTMARSRKNVYKKIITGKIGIFLPCLVELK